MNGRELLQCVDKACKAILDMPPKRRAGWLVLVLEDLDRDMPEEEYKDLLWLLVKDINTRLTTGRW